MRTPLYNPEDNFIQYSDESLFYIYIDTNASYASIHQYLENGYGKPCVVSNGNTKDAGACLAISYEAREYGISRGMSISQAKKICSNLEIYECCLPLYELYSDLYDMILEYIVPKEFFYRGSCDEVIIRFEHTKYPTLNYNQILSLTKEYIEEMTSKKIYLKLNEDQLKDIQSRHEIAGAMLAISHLIKASINQVIGLPISIAIAPSICVAKALIDIAKPKFIDGNRVYQTLHDAICFPKDRNELLSIYRNYNLKDLCGISEIAKRFSSNGYKKVKDLQDYVSLERSIQLARNVHLGKVAWYMAHGRDDILGGYLAAVRDRK